MNAPERRPAFMQRLAALLSWNPLKSSGKRLLTRKNQKRQSSDTVRAKVTPEGAIVFIYDDSTAPALLKLGRSTLRRVSHVEPNADGSWRADMSPLSGPVLSGFSTRQDALAAELLWLRKNHRL